METRELQGCQLLRELAGAASARAGWSGCPRPLCHCNQPIMEVAEDILVGLLVMLLLMAAVMLEILCAVFPSSALATRLRANNAGSSMQAVVAGLLFGSVLAVAPQLAVMFSSLLMLSPPQA
ncbi:hypothetical protein GOP47_0028000 [Adiantum capillus-veneris]|nr:hypothetical protein GOP47_0028000 [Adiantum capillus-veneris]